jgi:hypothetical protein
MCSYTFFLNARAVGEPVEPHADPKKSHKHIILNSQHHTVQSGQAIPYASILPFWPLCTAAKKLALSLPKGDIHPHHYTNV